MLTSTSLAANTVGVCDQLPSRKVAEEDGVRAGAGDAHPTGVLGDAGGDLQKPDHREIGLGEGMSLGVVSRTERTSQ